MYLRPKTPPRKGHTFPAGVTCAEDKAARLHYTLREHVSNMFNGTTNLHELLAYIAEGNLGLPNEMGIFGDEFGRREAAPRRAPARQLQRITGHQRFSILLEPVILEEGSGREGRRIPTLRCISDVDRPDESGDSAFKPIQRPAPLPARRDSSPQPQGWDFDVPARPLLTNDRRLAPVDPRSRKPIAVVKATNVQGTNVNSQLSPEQHRATHLELSSSLPAIPTVDPIKLLMVKFGESNGYLNSTNGRGAADEPSPPRGVANAPPPLKGVANAPPPLKGVANAPPALKGVANPASNNGKINLAACMADLHFVVRDIARSQAAADTSAESEHHRHVDDDTDNDKSQSSVLSIKECRKIPLPDEADSDEDLDNNYDCEFPRYRAPVAVDDSDASSSSPPPPPRVKSPERLMYRGVLVTPTATYDDGGIYAGYVSPVNVSPVSVSPARSDTRSMSISPVRITDGSVFARYQAPVANNDSVASDIGVERLMYGGVLVTPTATYDDGGVYAGYVSPVPSGRVSPILNSDGLYACNYGPPDGGAYRRGPVSPACSDPGIGLSGNSSDEQLFGNCAELPPLSLKKGAPNRSNPADDLPTNVTSAGRGSCSDGSPPDEATLRRAGRRIAVVRRSGRSRGTRKPRFGPVQ